MKDINKYIRIFFTLIILQIMQYFPAFSQDKISIDKGYYITYPDKLMLRLYLSQKFAPFTISSENEEELNYKSNSKLSLGAGFTYKSLSLNLAFGFGFLNPENGKGKTTGLDLQLHLYPKKWATDIVASSRKGYYLDPKDNNGLSFHNYYVRPDLKRNIFGLALLRVPNSNKFSYRAAFNQNDWQTKSAGSFLYGGEAFYGIVQGDSVLVPTLVNNIYKQSGIDKINFFSIGPGVGYAYTLVIDENFFVTGSVVAILEANFSNEHSNGSSMKKTSIIPGGIYKGALGYNSASWSVSANVTGNALYAGSASSSKEYFLPTGIIRFIIAKKIGLNKH